MEIIILYNSNNNINVTIKFLGICADCIHPQAKLCTKIFLAIYFYEWLPHCVTPVVDAANFLVKFSIFLCDECISSPNDKLLYTIKAAGCHNHCRYAAVTPAEQRICLHSKILKMIQNLLVSLSLMIFAAQSKSLLLLWVWSGAF